MRNIFLGTISVAMIATLSASPSRAADDWSFSITPYIWLPTVSGQLKYNIPPGDAGSPNVESGPNSYLENLDFALMLTGEARKGRWSLLGDLIYLDFAGSNAKTVSVNLPDGSIVPVVDAGTTTSLKGTLITLAPGYSIYSAPKAKMDVFAGVRYLTIQAKADWSITGPVGAFPATGAIKQDNDFWDGIIGMRGRAYLGAGNWSVPYYLDVGAGTSYFTWQAILAVSYSFSWGDVSLAYRYLMYDTSADNLLQNFSFSGPALGASFHF
jgi:hypothetical protein